MPVNWRLAPAEMAHILTDCGAAAVVVGADFFGHVEAIEAQLTAHVIAIGPHPAGPSSTTGYRAIRPPTPASSPGPTTWRC